MRHHADGDKLEVLVFLPLPPPSPRVFEATAMPWSEEERVRLHIGFRPTDFEATGLSIPAGATLSVYVDAARDLPTLVVGTYSYDLDEPRDIPLARGMNTIRDPKGGLLYIRYRAPKGSRATLTFGSKAEIVPTFRKGSDPAAWKPTLEASRASTAMLQSDRATIVVRRESALANAEKAPDLLLKTIDRVIDVEDEFAGLRPDERLKSRTLMAEYARNDQYMFATFYRTGYVSEAVNFILDPVALRTDGWGPWHELGHMRQQPAWRWEEMGEVTNNMFTRAVERAFGNTSRFDRDNIWPAIRAYLAKPDAERKYGNLHDPFVKLGLLEQLQLAYGDRLYQELARTVRANAEDPTDDAMRRDFFVVQTSRIAGHDLRDFFDAWGLEYSPDANHRVSLMNLPRPPGDWTKLEKPLVQSKPRSGAY